jgi:hypothetical protein
LKPWEVLVLDLSDTWRGMGKTMSSLAEVSYELGLEEPVLDMTGEQVFDYYWNKKDIDSIAKKCESDVITTIEVAKRLKV